MESRTIDMVIQGSRMGVDGNLGGDANKRIEEFMSGDEEDSEDRSIGKQSIPIGTTGEYNV